MLPSEFCGPQTTLAAQTQSMLFSFFVRKMARTFALG